MPDAFSAETLDAAIAEAHVPTLQMVICHLTRDTSILRPEWRPRVSSHVAPESQLEPEDQLYVRSVAREALIRYSEAGSPPLPDLDMRMLDKMIRYLIGDAAPEAYLPFLEEELGVADLRAPDWSAPVLRQGAAGLSAVIVGAGMSGLLAAIRFKQAGIAFTIIEKNPEVGGTWYDNTYPGCRVDSDNQLYSYSFEPNAHWPQHFSTQEILLEYFKGIVEKHDLRGNIRFGCKVEEAVFDDDHERWTLRYVDTDGATHALTADIFVSAVGQLNVPRFPDIPGRESFAGPPSIRRPGAMTSICGASASRWSAPVRAPSSSCPRSRPRSRISTCSSAIRRGCCRLRIIMIRSARGSAGSSRTCPSTRIGTASGCTGGRSTGCTTR